MGRRDRSHSSHRNRSRSTRRERSRSHRKSDRTHSSRRRDRSRSEERDRKRRSHKHRRSYSSSSSSPEPKRSKKEEKEYEKPVIVEETKQPDAAKKENKTEMDQKKLDRLNRFKKLAESRNKATNDQKKTVTIKIAAEINQKQEKKILSAFQGINEPAYEEKTIVEEFEDGIDPLDHFMSNLELEDDIVYDQPESVPEVAIDTSKIATLDDVLQWSAEPAPEEAEADGVDEHEEEFLSKLLNKTKTDRPERFEDDDEERERYFSDDEYDPLKVSMGSEYTELLAKIKSKRELPRVDHTKIEYMPFKKNFYVQVSSITNMSEHEVDAFRKANGSIRVYGKKCPRPISSFSQCGLPDPILSILQRRDYEKPFPIQMQCIPALMCGRDVIGIAETGSGKTLAFLLPAIRHALDQPKLRENDGMIVLIIAPTRELIMQISNECSKLSKSVGLKTLCVYGGAGIGEQLNALKRGAEIVCGTPGRLIDVLTISNGKVTNLRRVTFLVLDEADRMFDMGFSPQITAIVENIRPDRQTALFSATFPTSIENLAKKILSKPLQIIVGQRGKSASQVDQHVLVINEDKKLHKLLKLLGEWHEHGSIIIFVNRQLDADNLFTDLLVYGYECAVLHGGQDQTDREFTLHDFREGKKTILIATSIAARGIDVKSVVLVINYAAPDHFEDYVHRVGRTGRAGTIGTSYTFLTPEEAPKSHDIIKALRLASQEVPKELLQISQAHLATMDGKVKFRGGFGGKGFKFNETEKSRQQQERRNAIKLMGLIEDSDKEEETEEEEAEASVPQKAIAALQTAKELAKQFEKTPINQPTPMIKGLSCAGYIDATTGNTIDEFDINNYPDSVRVKITNREVLSRVAENTNVSLQVKGCYIPADPSTRNLALMAGSKGLYIEIVGPSVISVQRAVGELKMIVQSTMAPQPTQPGTKMTGRYSVIVSLGMDVYESDHDLKHIPVVPQLISLGLNHSLCISRTKVTNPPSSSRRTKDGAKHTVSHLNVYSWGKVPFNCLGQGVDVSTSEYPKIIPFFSGRKIAQVACGDYHSAVLVSSSKQHPNAGTVFTFGLGNSGRLGYHIDTNSDVLSQQIGTEDKDEPSWCTHTPQPVGLSIGLRNAIVSIACGANHTLVTTVDGCVYSWGMGAYGVLGTGSVANRYNPVKVVFPSDNIFISKCCAGSRHSMALDKEGNVWSWGYGGNGRLGLGSTRNYYTPNLIRIFDTYEVFQISCGDSHSACLDRFGTVYTWGCCRGGKLGLGKIVSDVLEPAVVESLKGTHIIQIACGTGNTLALSASGKIYQWGCTLGFNKQSEGLISNIDYVPQPVPDTGFKNVFIAAGPYSCAAINIFGDLLTWGLGTGYRLGHGDSKDHVAPKFVSHLRTRIYIDTLLKVYDETPMELQDNVKAGATNAHDEKRIQQIAVGDGHGVLLTCNGTVYTWGVNNGTGYNSTKDQIESYSEPMLFNHFSSKISKIACGSNHSLAITVNGLLFTWGCNDNGQLGQGDLRSRVIPDHVPYIENCINVFAGVDNSGCICSSNHEDFMKDDYGTLWVFGSSSCGKLGLGEALTSTVMTPREITTVTGVYKLALGSMHSVVLTHEGSLYSAGAGTGGRLGTGDTSNYFVFTPVKTEVKFVDVCAGSSHSLAISVDNELYGWGEGKYICSDEKHVLEPTLMEVIPSPTGEAKVISAVAAGNHSLVLTNSGYVAAFGNNTYGQLGVQLSIKSSANNFIKMPSTVNLDANVTCIATSRYFSSCSTL
nr:chromosome condensation protein [Theileria orientalis]